MACPGPPPADPALAHVIPATADKLMVANADGTNKVSIYSQTGCSFSVTEPSWSPNGKAIAFKRVCVSTGYLRELWRIDVSVVNGVPTGSNAKQLTAACGSCYDPAWSPTGDVIAVVGGADVSISDSIFLVDANTGVTTTFYRAVAGSDVLYVAWSSDGTRLAVVDGSNGLRGIKIVERATGNVVKTLPPPPTNGVFFIDWARQGVDKLAIRDDLSSPSNDPYIYTLDIATGTYTQIVAGNAPTWSPDNTKLAFSANGYINIIELVTGKVTQLWSGNFPDWRRF